MASFERMAEKFRHATIQTNWIYVCRAAANCEQHCAPTKKVAPNDECRRGRRTTHGCILLIEDEPSVAAFLRTALERRGYQITSSASASTDCNYSPQGIFAG